MVETTILTNQSQREPPIFCTRVETFVKLINGKCHRLSGIDDTWSKERNCPLLSKKVCPLSPQEES